MNKLFFVVCILFLNACAPRTLEEGIKMKFIDSYVNHINQFKDIYFFSAWPLNNGKKLNLTFFSYLRVNIDEARLLLVENMEDLILLANNDFKLNYCFDESSWSYKEIKFKIWFLNKSGDFINDNYIAKVVVENGIVEYIVDDSTWLVSVFSESYSKAKGIVEHQKNLRECERITGISTADMFSE
jgi:hypothetical protein